MQMQLTLHGVLEVLLVQVKHGVRDHVGADEVSCNVTAALRGVLGGGRDGARGLRGARAAPCGLGGAWGSGGAGRHSEESEEDGALHDERVRVVGGGNER